MTEVHCGSCGEEVPEGHFCVRCGAPLGDDPASAPASRTRGAFAAAPQERLNVPRLVSTLFPQLPRRSMASFQGALAFGVAVVLVLALLRVLPVALIAAAVLLPLLTLLYLYDVDIYEDEPTRVIGVTMIWGLVAGVGVGLLTRAVTSSGATFVTQSRGTTIIYQGVLLPLLGIALMLAGPLALLRYKRFNDVLDGVTFGAAAAAAFAGAEVITYSFSILSGGLRPGGAILEWLGRLTTIAVAIPVLEMAVIGSIAGAFWLRFRAPVRDREVLGVLGNPFLALIAGGILIVVGFSLQPLIRTGWWLLCLVVLDVLALLWLRRLIHLGLLEESAEIPIGPPITCANCGAQTPKHTFCINCGISLQALPKVRPEAGPGIDPDPGLEGSSA
jgi:ribosomal protein L32